MGKFVTVNIDVIHEGFITRVEVNIKALLLKNFADLSDRCSGRGNY